MEIVAVMRMLDRQVFNYLMPIALCPNVSRLWIIRPLPYGFTRTIPNSTYIEIEGRTRLSRFRKIYHQAVELGQRPEVAGFVNFNAIPYGLIALRAARRCRKPVQIGFIGDDWYRHAASWYGGPLNRMLRRADLFTTTGPGMREGLIAHGYPAERVVELPHAIDVDEFFPAPADTTPPYDALFCGALIHRKRVDLILAAWKEVVTVHSAARLLIVGDGPLRSTLEEQARSLGLASNVTFIGRQSDLAPHYRSARIVVIASDMEGFPFVLVEGMCCGAVPVSTRVGTIADSIADAQNGLLVPPGNSKALATALLRLLDNPGELERMRSHVLDQRSHYSFESCSKRWSTWLEQMISPK